MTNLKRTAMIVAMGLALAGCISDPRLNTGLSVGLDGVAMQPSVQANVGGGLLQYTPPLR
jgi:starvation-inducible outer membrane lipoprotein